MLCERPRTTTPLRWLDRRTQHRRRPQPPRPHRHDIRPIPDPSPQPHRTIRAAVSGECIPRVPRRTMLAQRDSMKGRRRRQRTRLADASMGRDVVSCGFTYVVRLWSCCPRSRMARSWRYLFSCIGFGELCGPSEYGRSCDALLELTRQDLW